jgi:hypothetical protein
MLADCFTKPLLKPIFWRQCAAIGMIGMGLWNGLGIGIGNGHGNGHGNRIGTGNAIGNAIGK